MPNHIIYYLKVLLLVRSNSFHHEQGENPSNRTTAICLKWFGCEERICLLLITVAMILSIIFLLKFLPFFLLICQSSLFGTYTFIKPNLSQISFHICFYFRSIMKLPVWTFKLVHQDVVFSFWLKPCFSLTASSGPALVGVIRKDSATQNSIALSWSEVELPPSDIVDYEIKYFEKVRKFCFFVKIHRKYVPLLEC